MQETLAVDLLDSYDRHESRIDDDKCEDKAERQPLLMVPNPRRVHHVTIDRGADSVRRLHICAQRFLFAPVLQLLLQGTPVDAPHPKTKQTPLATLCVALNKRYNVKHHNSTICVAKNQSKLSERRGIYFSIKDFLKLCLSTVLDTTSEDIENANEGDDPDFGSTECSASHAVQKSLPTVAALRVARLLLSFGADPNIACALHLVARTADKGHSEKYIARFLGILLQHGADPTLGEDMGKDAFMCCTTQRIFQKLHMQALGVKTDQQMDHFAGFSTHDRDCDTNQVLHKRHAWGHRRSGWRASS